MLPIVKAVTSLDEKAVAACLEKNPDIFKQDNAPTDILHTMLTQAMSPALLSPGRRVVIYLLRNYGLDINTQNQDGDSPLHLLLRTHGDTELCEALLQCGADIHLRNQSGVSPSDLAASPSCPERTRELVTKYKPGLWRAVQDDDLMSVRKLINLWCSVDVSKNGRSLKELALSKGTEHIIRLILDIAPSMRLAHCALAGDVTGASRILDAGDKKVNVDFKNMGDMGAPPLFYAIMHNSLPLVELLRARGAKMDLHITFEDNDIPLYFTSLNKDIDPEIIKCLTPTPDENKHFCRLHYKGRTVLQYCIENQIAPSVVRHILKRGYPELVAQRTQTGQCVRDFAEKSDKGQYVKVIDEVVHEWYLDSDSSARRLLALYGYRHLRQATKEGVEAGDVIQSMETSSPQAKFDSELHEYQDQIERLHAAVESGNVPETRALLTYTGPHSDCFTTALANSRNKLDGQPLLHKAVLRQTLPVVDQLTQSLTASGVRVDDVVDARLRTALHYAYASPAAREIVYTLQDHGASDFTLDKDCRSPLVFRDHRNKTEMFALVQYHIAKAFHNEEPWPWQPLKIPLIGPDHHGNNHHANLRQFTGEESTGGCPGEVCQWEGPSLQSREAGQGGDEDYTEGGREEVIYEDDEYSEEEEEDEDGANDNTGRSCVIL